MHYDVSLAGTNGSTTRTTSAVDIGPKRPAMQCPLLEPSLHWLVDLHNQDNPPWEPLSIETSGKPWDGGLVDDVDVGLLLRDTNK